MKIKQKPNRVKPDSEHLKMPVSGPFSRFSLPLLTDSRDAKVLEDKQSRLLEHACDLDEIYFFLPHEAPLAHKPKVKVVSFRKVLEDLEGDPDMSTQAMLRELFAERS